MGTSTRTVLIGSILLLVIAELVPVSSVRIGLIRDAQAVVGAPVTPVSVAGVARRTTRRTTAAVATSTAATTTAAAAPPPPATPPPAAPASASSAGPPPVGTVVGTLPAGCVATQIGGVEYSLCNGVYYRAAFQGNNLVYVVQKP
jgi:hypothetical protein